MRRFTTFFTNDWFALFGPLTALAWLPTLSTWLKYRFEITGSDLLVPLSTGLLASLLMTALFFRIFKSNRLAGLGGAIIPVLLFENGYMSRLEAVLPVLRALNPLTSLFDHDIFYGMVFTAVILLCGYIVARAIERFATTQVETRKIYATALSIVIAVSFTLQLFSVVRVMAVQWSQYSYRPPQLAVNNSVGVEKPDVYYIVLDRYTSQQVLKDQFNFDNSDFTNYLSENNFLVNNDAKGNYPYTTMSIASTLTASYHTDQVKKFANKSEQTIMPYHDTIRNSSVIQAFKNMGYQYSLLGSWYETTNQSPLADNLYQPEGILTVFNQKIILNNFSKKLLTRSAYFQYIQHGFSIGSFDLVRYSGISEAEATTYKLKQLKKIAEQPSGQRFIMAHILVPHDPYYFNADGSLSTTYNSDNLGAPIKQKYVGQVEYINTEMKDIIDTIKKNSDSKAIIVLQSDEGPYPMILNGEQFDYHIVGEELSNADMRNWSDKDLAMKYGVLAAYSVPKASSEELAQADSVNIFRVIMNVYFNAKLPYLPKCYYAYPNGRDEPFVYTNINKRLTGQDNSACSEKSD